MNAPDSPAAPTLVDLQQTLYTSRNPTRRWLHCSRRDWILGALERHAPTTARECALEVGPGSGVYLPTLATLFRETIATDIEPAYLEHARRSAAGWPNLRLQEDDICASRLPAASVDLVLCSEVIEHLRRSQSQAALDGIARILRPGGVLVLSTPQRYSLLELAAKVAFLPGVISLVRRVYREPVLETGHINLMTVGTVRRQLLAAGFEVVEHHLSGVYLPLVAEFGGDIGLRLQRWLEPRLRGWTLRHVLWTQYYVARRRKA